MSVNGAMQAGVTALAANSVALASISNNIANVNTTGYKRVVTNFANLVTSGGNHHQLGAGGVIATSMQTIANIGELSPSNSGYSLGIDGQGFFVVSDTLGDMNTSSGMMFTRDGTFTTDKEGYLINASGLYLRGWPADQNGNISTSATDVSILSPINVGNISATPEATTRVIFDTNLDSTTPVSTAASTTYNAASATQSMTAYDATTGVGTKPDSTITMKVSDSLGQEHTITVSMLRMSPDTAGAAAGRIKWAYEIASGDITSASAVAEQISTGNLYFDENGALDLTNSTGGLINGITIGASTGGVAPNWLTNFSTAGQSIAFGLGTADSTLTSTAKDTVTSSVLANGTEFANISKVEVGSDGMVTAFYSNGNKRNLAKVPLASFVNANGLQPVSGNAYQLSIDSGPFTIKEAGEGGAGFIASSALEASTVDLSQEFTNLITTQRAYSAASKIITTADEMLQELLSIKR